MTGKCLKCTYNLFVISQAQRPNFPGYNYGRFHGWAVPFYRRVQEEVTAPNRPKQEPSIRPPSIHTRNYKPAWKLCVRPTGENETSCSNFQTYISTCDETCPVSKNIPNTGKITKFKKNRCRNSVVGMGLPNGGLDMNQDCSLYNLIRFSELCIILAQAHSILAAANSTSSKPISVTSSSAIPAQF